MQDRKRLLTISIFGGELYRVTTERTPMGRFFWIDGPGVGPMEYREDRGVALAFAKSLAESIN